MTLSVIMITKNSADVVGEALKSVEDLWDELLVDDAGSRDETISIVSRYGGNVIHSGKTSFGERKQWLIDYAKSDFILLLDADERVSIELHKEIHTILDKQTSFDKFTHMRDFVKSGNTINNGRRVDGYLIPYQNYIFGKPVFHGGESYRKVRLFRRKYGSVLKLPLHEEVVVQGAIANLHGVLDHHSYRSIHQLFSKFTYYAKLAAHQKIRQKEHVTLKKLFMYGPHMLWSRFIKDDGFRDGWQGFILAIAFAYMESLTYWLVMFQR